MKTQIVEEQEILTEFKIKSEEKDKISNKLYNFYNEIISEMFKTAKTKEDFISIKKRLRVVPDCPEKVLLFRRIIIHEQENS